MVSSVFITVDQLQKLISKKKIVLVDCRYSLDDPELGYKEYLNSHIPGSIYAHLDYDLSGEITELSGRHPLPLLTNFVKWIEKNGISPNRRIIVYDDLGGGIASRLWWMLKQINFQNVKILIGGIQAWKRENFKLNSGEEHNSPVKIDIEIKKWKDGVYKVFKLDDILSLPDNTILIDSRSPERYMGDEEPIDLLPGKIPGAINYFWKENLNENLEIKDKNSLKNNLLQKLSMENNSELIFYCGSGVTACFNLAILEHLNKKSAGLYPGSYSEWVRNFPNKIEKNSELMNNA